MIVVLKKLTRYKKTQKGILMNSEIKLTKRCSLLKRLKPLKITK